MQVCLSSFQKSHLISSTYTKSHCIHKVWIACPLIRPKNLCTVCLVNSAPFSAAQPLARNTKNTKYSLSRNCKNTRNAVQYNTTHTYQQPSLSLLHSILYNFSIRQMLSFILFRSFSHFSPLPYFILSISHHQLHSFPLFSSWQFFPLQQLNQTFSKYFSLFLLSAMCLSSSVGLFSLPLHLYLSFSSRNCKCKQMIMGRDIREFLSLLWHCRTDKIVFYTDIVRQSFRNNVTYCTENEMYVNEIDDDCQRECRLKSF